MSWNNEKSLKLTKFVLTGGIGFMILLVFGFPWLTSEIKNYAVFTSVQLTYLTIVFYIVSIPVFVSLFMLYKLIMNIQNNKVFVAENTKIIRSLSWQCFLGSLLFLIFSFVYIPSIFLSMLAAFFGVMLRVLKNVFAAAVELKKENDFTI